MPHWAIQTDATCWRRAGLSWKDLVKNLLPIRASRKLTLVNRSRLSDYIFHSVFAAGHFRSGLKSSRRKAFSLFACITLLIAFASCNREPQPIHNRDLSVINIGYFGDLSGPTFNFGMSGKNGVLMAAE